MIVFRKGYSFGFIYFEIKPDIMSHIIVFPNEFKTDKVELSQYSKQEILSFNNVYELESQKLLRILYGKVR